jgi:hypothetical protein
MISVLLVANQKGEHVISRYYRCGLAGCVFGREK